MVAHVLVIESTQEVSNVVAHVLVIELSQRLVLWLFMY